MRRGEYYYYRKRREAGRVRSEYFGKGERAAAAALEDGCARPVLNIQDVKKGGDVTNIGHVKKADVANIGGVKKEAGGKSPAGSKAASDFLGLLLKKTTVKGR